RRARLGGHQAGVVGVGFSHSGRFRASSSWDGEFRLWDLAAERVLLTASGTSQQTLFSPDDRRIAYAKRGKQSGFLELTTSSISRRLTCKRPTSRGAYSVDLSPDGRLVAAAFEQGVHIWADQKMDEPVVLPAPYCYSAIFTPDGANLIVCGESGLARWPLQRMEGTASDQLRIGPRQPIQDRANFNYAALSADGRWVAAANPGARSVSIYE